ncbi:hypothetical protein DesLBE_0639 [Desulfitobacterium sp. LBE]|uniref:hypothetical protein n=1 Tax=Desulfitobacterium sp. LBE TaxID=884086 RepID=UPI00119A9D7E|nr:hypothetical protein [Desulfitobacterium sp. LBE]TWH56436.1 hypothetical protein DesLBE_0639 [Desulfitobacterium sp. LBE]
MKNKFIALVLALILVLSSPVKEARANPLLVLTPQILAAAGTLLVAGGVVFASEESMYATATDFLSRYSTLGIAEKIKDVGVGNVLTITKDIAGALWDYSHGVLPGAISNQDTAVEFHFSSGQTHTINAQPGEKILLHDMQDWVMRT